MSSKRKPEEPKAGAPEYMSTYGDMVTLLLCFFVLLYSMSNLDQQKFQAVANAFAGGNLVFTSSGSAESINELLGSGIMEMARQEGKSKDDSQDTMKNPSKELNQIASNFQSYLEQQNLRDKVSVQVESQFVRIRFADGILFDTGKANLKEDVIPVLDAIANEMQGYTKNDIRVEGHTDTDPINSPQFPNNLYLSAARAITVQLFFIEEKGFDPRKMSAEGFGEYRPVAPNDTPENKAKNRRVEIKIMSEQFTDPRE